MFDSGLGVSITSLTGGLNHSQIQILRNSGIRTFELNPVNFVSDYDRAVREAFKKMLAETGKKAISYHIPFTKPDDLSDPDETIRIRALSRFRALLKEAEFFGSEILILHPSTEPVDQSLRPEHIAQLRKSMAEVEAEIQERKMRLALELLPRQCMGNMVADLRKMLDGFSDTFGCCLDVNHLMGQFRTLPAIVRDLGPKLIALHISDYDGIDERHWLPGMGVIDWKAFLEALRDIGYTGPFNYEVKLNYEVPTPDWIAAIESNFRRMKHFLQ
ncbi:MAG: Inosose isomerase [Lentisphaerae bacterium ADurb.Bin242]|nr:MAG: Inosose isomerase [Lentisphaerae bacterium ADurb.Bin242]